MATLQLWCKSDIAALLGCDRKVLGDIISEDVKQEIGFKDGQEALKGKRKIYTLTHVHKILTDVYPFKTEQERLKMLFPQDY